MHLILNYLIFILITISKTITFANEQNSERPQQTVKTAGLKTRKISKLGRDHLNDPREELPLSTVSFKAEGGLTGIKGIIHVPCRFATLVFRPYIAGEIFEFKFLEIVPNIIDKCSKLEYEYFH
uniref:Uncharacterized protein n=1 Tax=Meloidogyne hapla TaxID=6305 RepID=A0A1I8BYP2_MELHA